MLSSLQQYCHMKLVKVFGLSLLNTVDTKTNTFCKFSIFKIDCLARRVAVIQPGKEPCLVLSC